MTLIDSSWWFIISYIKWLRSLFFLNWFGVVLLFLNHFILHLWSFTTLGSRIWNLRKRSLLLDCGFLGTLLSSLFVWIRIRIWITDNLQRFLRILLKLFFFLTLVLLTHILKRLHVFNVFVLVGTLKGCLFYSSSSCSILSITRTFWSIFKIRLWLIDYSRTF